jgi:predicted DNA-binding transcriptional regulator YafY
VLHDYDKILTRLTTILQRLYEGDTLSVTGLADEFNVSTKTIQRDFNERLIRFPIEKSGRRWKMQQGFRLEKARSTGEELVLDMLETIAEGIGPSFGNTAASLLGRLKNRSISAIDSKTVIEDILEYYPVFLIAEQGIEEKRIVSFSFRGSQRKIKPYKIVSFEGYWYLYGEEDPKGKLKTFYFKDIDTLSLTGEGFVHDDDALIILDRAVNAWFEPGNEPYEVILYADASIAKYFYRRPLAVTQRIIRTYCDGAVDIEILATSEREVLHEVKKWLPNLLVRSPRPLALKARKMAQEFVESQIRIILE